MFNDHIERHLRTFDQIIYRMKSENLIEDLLISFKEILDVDYDKYRNHVYRVFLNCLLIDDNKDNEEKYAIAAVFHDIGIWTDHTIDYLNPSIKQVTIYLSETGQRSWVDEIKVMIDCHHKMRKYKGRHERTVESFRKADWIDITVGLMSFGLEKKKIDESKIRFPNHDFHFFLIKKIAKNFLKHPFNPLPMVRK